jgi:hypothetical protein
MLCVNHSGKFTYKTFDYVDLMKFKRKNLSLFKVLGLLDNPLVNYLIRLQKIYSLDLEVLDRLIALLKGVNVEVAYQKNSSLSPR